MSKKIRITGNRPITVVYSSESADAISDSDAEMDLRAREAVKAAINRAQICKKPVARYDKISKKAYLETADGEKKYV